MSVIDWILIAVFIIFVGATIRHGIMHHMKDDSTMHYYMFSVEDKECIVYVSSKDMIKPEDMDNKRIEVGTGLELSKEESLNIGISYIGCFSEKKMSKQK